MDSAFAKLAEELELDEEYKEIALRYSLEEEFQGYTELFLMIAMLLSWATARASELDGQPPLALAILIFLYLLYELTTHCDSATHREWLRGTQERQKILDEFERVYKKWGLDLSRSLDLAFVQAVLDVLRSAPSIKVKALYWMLIRIGGDINLSEGIDQCSLRECLSRLPGYINESIPPYSLESYNIYVHDILKNIYLREEELRKFRLGQVEEQQFQGNDLNDHLVNKSRLQES
jgi:hypothetical protein